ncbi:MAG: DUF1579 family protein [Acidobacteriota bacterium]
MGMPFEGLGLWAYDNIKKEYVSTWADSMSTGIMVSRGKTRKSREVLRIEDAGKFQAGMFETGPDGKKFKSMEMVYTRK